MHSFHSFHFVSNGSKEPIESHELAWSVTQSGDRDVFCARIAFAHRLCASPLRDLLYVSALRIGFAYRLCVSALRKGIDSFAITQTNNNTINTNTNYNIKHAQTLNNCCLLVALFVVVVLN